MLIIDQISHRYEGLKALHEVSLEARPGELTCLVGASGCGKTTALRLAAGLMPLQSGRIVLGDQLLADASHSLPAEQRPVGLVFQEGALFPHMSVADNIGFGLPRAERRGRVAELLDEVDLTEFAARYPHSLSGGQRQRIALARALAPRPKALLFDEPYANLDMQLRCKLRDQARHMVRQTGTVGVVVTHDPDEVLAIADRVVVLDAGHVVQSGSPRSLYTEPATLGVALMFGRAQKLSGKLSGNLIQTDFGEWPRECLQNPGLAPGDITLAVRPHDLVLTNAGTTLTVSERRIADGADEYVLIDERSQSTLTITEPLRKSGAKAPEKGDRVSVTPRGGTVFAVASVAG